MSEQSPKAQVVMYCSPSLRACRHSSIFAIIQGPSAFSVLIAFFSFFPWLGVSWLTLEAYLVAQTDHLSPSSSSPSVTAFVFVEFSASPSSHGIVFAMVATFPYTFH